MENSRAAFRAEYPDIPMLDMDEALMSAFSCTRAQLHTGLYTADEERVSRARRFCQRLRDGEPIQYVLGETYFCGRRFICDRRALIPRPESELLVETALREMQEGASVLDAGCGSGILGISIVLARGDTEVTMLDISPEALALSGENAKALGAKVALLHGDMRMPMQRRYDAIVSNPPYIAPDEKSLMDASVLRFEPQTALFGGEDGLMFFRALAARAEDSLNSGGFLLAECGFRQAAAVSRLLVGAFSQIQVLKDFNGLDRAVLAKGKL